MTKRTILKWLESKRSEAAIAVRKEFTLAQDKAINELCCDLGFAEDAQQMQEHFERAHKIWMDFKQKCENIEGFRFANCYHSPESRLYEYIGEKGTTFNRLISSEIRVKTESMKKAQDAFNDLLANINMNYNNVIAAVGSLKTVKESAEYLTALGFDLSELEKKPEPVTALAVQIDTSYLMLNKAA